MQLTQATLVSAVTLGVLLTTTQPVLAQPIDDRRATASLRIYNDDDHMTVVTPSAGLQVPIGTALGFDVNTTADIISGASVDVISEASPTAIEETRLEVGAGLVWRASRLVSLRTRFVGSHETDFESLRLVLGANAELGQRNTTVDLAYTAGDDEVTSANDATFVDDRRSHRLTATLTQVVDQQTYVDFIADVVRTSGYQANPYRTVRIVDPDSSAFMRVDEVVPRLRKSAALFARVRRAIDSQARVVAHLGYRFYIDDWDIASHTTTITTIARINKRVKLGATLRGYLQSAAEFYQPYYNLEQGAPPELRTRERRLGRMRSLFASTTLDVALTKRGARGPRLVLAGALMGFWWPDFPSQERRIGVSMSLGLSTLLN